MKVLSLTVAILASQCANAQDCAAPTDAEIIVIRESFATVLFDNESARFREVCRRTTDRGVVFCGLLNAKNQLGAYVGFQPFFVMEGRKGHARSEAMTPPELLEFETIHCYSCSVAQKTFDECIEDARPLIEQ